MTGPAIAIGPGDFTALFPFHLACDEHFVVVQVGPSLGKLCPGLAPGTRFADHFRIRRPDVGPDLAAVIRNRDTLFVLEHTGSPLVLRAQVLPVPPQDLVVFLGSPWLQDRTELGKLDLSLTDFAPHDATADLLHLVQASAVALRDTRKLADKLAQQRAQLREANEALRASETRFRNLSEQSPLGVLTMDLDGQVTFVNRRLVSALGGTEQQVLGNAWKGLFPPERVAEVQALLSSLAPGDEPVNFVLPLRRPDGSEGWVSITARASEDNAGRPTGFSCVTIAYKQPVTAPEIAEIRGVNTAGVLGTLLDRRLIKIVGRKSVVGRPFMYGTTREFLDRFGLKDLSDLPKIEDMADLLGFEPPSGLTAATESAAPLPFDEVAKKTDKGESVH